jgi:DSF synthase
MEQDGTCRIAPERVSTLPRLPAMYFVWRRAMQIIDRTRAHLHTVPLPGMAANAPRLLSTPILTSRYEAETRALWMYAHPTGRPCFTPELLADVVAQQQEVELAPGTVDFFLNCSGVPGVYNLGGDLDLFQKLVEAGDEAGLMRYAEACIRAINNNVAGLHADAVSMAVVQGDALGGGFEAALSCHVVIAERGAKLGFPEMMFNLFPGMGAYSLVARKAGPRVAEDLILNAKVLPAEKMHELGLVDHLAEPGRGEWVRARRDALDVVPSSRGSAPSSAPRCTPTCV